MNLVTGTRRPRRDTRQASEIVRERARKATKSMTTDLQGGQIRPRHRAVVDDVVAHGLPANHWFG
jgi:hypothetical protein